MHSSVMAWVAEQIPAHLPAPKVLEVGSYDVNGTVRPLFAHARYYLGIDIRPGPGVDLAVWGHPWPIITGDFDIVVSTEMLEHDDRPWESVADMHAALRTGGLLILTARGFDERGCFPVHDYPGDHWRWSVTGMAEMLYATGFVSPVVVPDPEAPGVFATAVKP